MTAHRFFAAVLAVTIAAAGPAARADETPEQLLAERLARLSMMLVETEPLTAEPLSAAIVLLSEAIALDPDNEEFWRIRLEQARLAERDALASEALRELTRLAPADPRIRLLRLTDVIEQYNTMEERVAAYERLLQTDNRRRLGPAVASRLAMDLALLYERAGNTEQFGHWLGEAVSLDPANRMAAATAAGFFRMNVRDAVAEAELLTTVVLADPTEPTAQAALGGLLLDHGAYAAAARIYRLAGTTYRMNGRPPTGDLLADLALAQWASGDTSAAMRTIIDRQRELDEQFRIRVRQSNPEIDRFELAKMNAPLTPTLATVRAVIDARSNSGHAAESYERAMAAYQLLLTRLTQDESRPVMGEVLARFTLEMAWVSIWLGDRPEATKQILEKIEELQPLSDTARARFDGWMALRLDEPERARALLAPIADKDAAAALGLAEAALALGDRKAATRSFARAVQLQPGSMIGVWSGQRLRDLLGQRVPVGVTAARLQQLIDSIPLVLDRIATDPTQAISLRIVPHKSVYEPHEPLLVDIEVTNNSPFPLAIDRNGPIRPQVVITPFVGISRDISTDRLPPLVVDVDRTLRLDPRQTVRATINLRLYQRLDSVLVTKPLRGAIIKLKGAVNPVVSQRGAVLPGFLGSEFETPEFRINGLRATTSWLADMAQRMNDPNQSVALTELSLMTQIITPAIVARAPEEGRLFLSNAGFAMTAEFGRLDPVSQAWIITMLPTFDRMEPLMEIARKSEHRLVRLCYMMYRAEGPDDPVISAARDADDGTLRTIARMLTWQLTEAAKQQQQQQQQQQRQQLGQPGR